MKDLKQLMMDSLKQFQLIQKELERVENTIGKDDLADDYYYEADLLTLAAYQVSQVRSGASGAAP